MPNPLVVDSLGRLIDKTSIVFLSDIGKLFLPVRFKQMKRDTYIYGKRYDYSSTPSVYDELQILLRPRNTTTFLLSGMIVNNEVVTNYNSDALQDYMVSVTSPDLDFTPYKKPNSKTPFSDKWFKHLKIRFGNRWSHAFTRGRIYFRNSHNDDIYRTNIDYNINRSDFWFNVSITGPLSTTGYYYSKNNSGSFVVGGYEVFNQEFKDWLKEIQV